MDQKAQKTGNSFLKNFNNEKTLGHQKIQIRTSENPQKKLNSASIEVTTCCKLAVVSKSKNSFAIA